jgi:hypothetical protein
MSELVEAVVLSGTRRGEIVTIDLDESHALGDENLTHLSRALGELEAAVTGVIEETRGLKSDLRSATERMASDLSGRHLSC